MRAAEDEVRRVNGAVRSCQTTKPRTGFGARLYNVKFKVGVKRCHFSLSFQLRLESTHPLFLTVGPRLRRGDEANSLLRGFLDSFDLFADFTQTAIKL